MATKGRGPNTRRASSVSCTVRENKHAGVACRRTPAQMFHMLRRQMRQVVPQAAHRHDAQESCLGRLSVSSLEDLSGGGFDAVIGEIDDVPASSTADRVLQRQRCIRSTAGAPQGGRCATWRWCAIESSIPSRADEYQAMLNRLPNAREVVWCQEEPQNQAPGYQIRHRLQELVMGRRPVLNAGRGPVRGAGDGITKSTNRSSRPWSRRAAMRPHRGICARDHASDGRSRGGGATRRLRRLPRPCGHPHKRRS